MKEFKKNYLLWLLLPWIVFLNAGCSINEQAFPVQPKDTSPPNQIPSPTLTQAATSSPLPTHFPTQIINSSERNHPAASPTPAGPKVPWLCSPLKGITLDNISEIITNPFNPPREGSDDPHQGIDLSIIDPATGFALEGNPITAVLSGRVAAVINDRFPYGNAIIIETPLMSHLKIQLPSPLLSTSAQVSKANTTLTCPQITVTPSPKQTSNSYPSSLSLYHLYAHLKEPADYQIEDHISCGSVLGEIGNSGNAINPHLHLEIRLGPPGILFQGMAHYDTRASLIEMANYCTWRVSGSYQLINPLDLLSLPQQIESP